MFHFQFSFQSNTILTNRAKNGERNFVTRSMYSNIHIDSSNGDGSDVSVEPTTTFRCHCAEMRRKKLSREEERESASN